MTRLVIERLEKRFGNVAALKSLSLRVEEGELISLLGPSGCGKTTTLRCVAGFEQPDAGEILFDAQNITQLPPERRDIGMVFQNYALFPHMTVAQNLAFGLEMRKVSQANVAERVKQALRMVQLEAMLDRYPRQLSGGQQQRVALARALVIEPRMLLLDEPLANLDASLREEMRFFIRDLQQRVGITTLYVTHDQSEAMVMSDRVVVMFSGEIAQVGPPRELYARPASREVAQFIGRTQFVKGTVLARRDAEHVELETPLGIVVSPAASSLAAGQQALLVVRPEALQLAAAEQTSAQALRGQVIRTYFLGGSVEHVLAFTGGVSLFAHTSPGSDIAAGAQATLSIDERQLWALPASGMA
ncbi:MAG: ABC transporter ATP-binding protein [Betaproteobacteria bacterium]|nr:ABC transporter ATP-binding protein [Betaproteobacteria bacterium]